MGFGLLPRVVYSTYHYTYITTIWSCKSVDIIFLMRHAIGIHVRIKLVWLPLGPNAHRVLVSHPRCPSHTAAAMHERRPLAIDSRIYR